MIDPSSAHPCQQWLVEQLVSEACEQLSWSGLVRDETHLAAVEMPDKGKRSGTGAGLFGAAGVLDGYDGAAPIAARQSANTPPLRPT